MAIAFVAANTLFVMFWPTVIAFRKGHPQRRGILLVNVFFGWSLMGWLFALVWAMRGPIDRRALPIVGDARMMQQAPRDE